MWMNNPMDGRRDEIVNAKMDRRTMDEWTDGLTKQLQVLDQ